MGGQMPGYVAKREEGWVANKQVANKHYGFKSRNHSKIMATGTKYR
jgi:hypothetical protein